MLIHAPCGGNDLYRFLGEWSKLNPTLVNTMLISNDNTMVNPYLFQPFGFTNFCVYPKVHRPVTLDDLKDEKVFVKEFLWETLLSDNCDDAIVKEDECLCICDICIDVFEVCDEFISHLKSEEHRNRVFEIVPCDSCDKPKHFCQVCNYPAYDKHNMLIHNESEEHKVGLSNGKTHVHYPISICPFTVCGQIVTMSINNHVH
ncbi:hypothetical protein HA466_0127140 [Hirschfeldia incana]|nr:hypothetical protein HA466_0127140 [Hirschfeldia incana]